MPLSSPLLDFLGPSPPSRHSARPAAGPTTGKSSVDNHVSIPSAGQQQGASSSPQGMLSRSSFSSAQSSSTRRTCDTTFGSAQDDPIIRSPDQSPILASKVRPSRPPSPLSCLDAVGGAVGERDAVHARERNANRLPSDDEASRSDSPDLPTVQELLAEHNNRSSKATATSSQQQLRGTQDGSSFNDSVQSPALAMLRSSDSDDAAARSPSTSAQLLMQSFPAYQPPQKAGGRSTESQAAHSSTSSHGRTDHTPQTVAAMEAGVRFPRVRALSPDAWTEEELGVLRQSLAQRKGKKAAFADFVAKFPSSRLSWQAFRSKYKTMVRAAHDEEEDEDTEGEEEEGCLVEESSGSQGPESDEGEDDEHISTTAASAPGGARKASWPERDDRLLKLGVAQNSRGSRIDWANLVTFFNGASEEQRTRGALEKRWYNLTIGNARRSATEANKDVRASRKRKRTSESRRVRPYWRDEEELVLRKILAQYTDPLGSQSMIYRDFYRALPRSERSRRALREKCRRLWQEGGGRDEEEGSEDESDESEDDEESGYGADDSGGVAMAQSSAVPPPASGRTAQTRSARRLLPLEKSQAQDREANEAQTPAPHTPSRRIDFDADLDLQPMEEAQPPVSTSAAERQQPRPAAVSAGSTTTAPAADRHAISATPATASNAAAPVLSSGAALLSPPATISATAGPSSIQVPPTFSFTSSSKGIRIKGCFPGLEILVFSGGEAQIFHHASAVPAFENPPLLHLRCLPAGNVRPLILSQKVSIRLGSARETAFDVEEGFSVVLLS